MTTKRRKRHNPEQIVRKLRDADAMLNAGRIWRRRSTYARWRIQYGGINAKEAARLAGFRLTLRQFTVLISS